MADTVTLIARNLARPASAPVAGQRWEIAELLARVDAAIARRAA